MIGCVEEILQTERNPAVKEEQIRGAAWNPRILEGTAPVEKILSQEKRGKESKTALINAHPMSGKGLGVLPWLMQQKEREMRKSKQIH